jgi:valyl-tRNA synthetase
VVTRVRALRAESGIPPKAKLDLFLDAADPAVARFLAEQAPLIAFLGRVETIGSGAGPEGSRRDVVAGVEIALAMERQAMTEEECKRLTKELEKLDTEIGRAEERLSNEQFLAKAPAQVVANGRASLAQMKERRTTLRSTLGLA